jgi:hypothetical protein
MDWLQRCRDSLTSSLVSSKLKGGRLRDSRRNWKIYRLCAPRRPNATSWRLGNYILCFETPRTLLLQKQSRAAASLERPKTQPGCRAFWTAIASWSGSRCRLSDRRRSSSLRAVSGEMQLVLQIACAPYERKWKETSLEHHLEAERLLETLPTVFWVAFTVQPRFLESLLSAAQRMAA